MTAESLRRAGNPAAAVDMCRDALIRFPGHLSARVTLGWALLDLGKLNDAQQEFEAVRRQAPDNLAAIRGLAKLHTLHDSDGFQEYEEAEPAGDPAAHNPPPAPVLPPAPVQWSAPPAPSPAPETLDSLDDLDPFVAADDLDPFVAADPLESFDPLESVDTPETPEPPEPLELFEPLDERDAFAQPVPPTAAVASPAPSAVVFQLERWLARVEARRSEGLTECA